MHDNWVLQASTNGITDGELKFGYEFGFKKGPTISQKPAQYRRLKIPSSVLGAE